MAVKLRLMRMGKKKQPTYRVVAADARSPRDGRFIELIGRYDPRQEPSLVEIDNDKARAWLAKGAQPTPQVRKLLQISGATEAPPGATTPSAPEAPPAAKAVKGHRPEIHVVGEEAADAARDEEAPMTAAAAAASAVESVATSAPEASAPEDAAPEDAPVENAPAEDAR